jgi:BNR repeat-like domain/BNR/Asp-box repeat
MRLRLAIPLASIALSAGAQTVHIAPISTVTEETEPRRFTEPHLAIHPANPNHLLAAAWSAPLSEPPSPKDAGAERCSSFVSHDGGATWSRHDFPITRCVDPQIAILPNGQAVFLGVGNFPGIVPERGTWLIAYHSSDGGTTWDEKPTLIGHGHDHPAIVVDVTNGQRKGWVYVTTHYEWRDGNGQLAATVFVTRSRDGGRTFDRPTEVAPSSLHAVAEMPVMLSDGSIVASFVEDAWSTPSFANRRAFVIRSNDGATTFSPASFVNDACGPPPRFQLSALAVDASDGPFRDRLYFACRQSGGGSVIVASSADRGATWNRPGVVVGSSPPDLTARRVMSMAVNNRGVLGVLVVERRPAARESCLETTFAASFDGGVSFTPPERVSASSCGASSTDAAATRLFPTYGDYFGIVTTPDGSFRVMWPEMRSGHSVLLTSTIVVDGRAAGPLPNR